MLYLIGKGISNIYLNFIIEKNWLSRFSEFKKFVPMSVFEGLRLKQQADIIEF